MFKLWWMSCVKMWYLRGLVSNDFELRWMFLGWRIVNQVNVCFVGCLYICDIWLWWIMMIDALMIIQQARIRNAEKVVDCSSWLVEINEDWWQQGREEACLIQEEDRRGDHVEIEKHSRACRPCWQMLKDKMLFLAVVSHEELSE